MSDPGYLKCACQLCCGHIEFPGAAVGQTIDCPHCGGKTTLLDPSLSTENPPGSGSVSDTGPTKPRRTIPALCISILVIVVLVAMGVFSFRDKAQRSAIQISTNDVTRIITNSESSGTSSPATDSEELVSSVVTLQHEKGSALVYATGTVANHSNHQRFGVRVELEVVDKQNIKIGDAGDYVDVMEPHKSWQFRALLPQPKAAGARIAKIDEQK